MHRALRRRLFPVLATICATAFAVAIAAPTASAWQVVSEHGGINFDEASTVRGADGALHIVYKDLGDGSVGGVRYRTLSTAGVLGAPETAVGGWQGVNNPDIELIAGAPHVFFSGLQSSDSSNPFNGGQAWTSNRASGAWALSPTPMSQANTVYPSTQVSSALDGSNQPWITSTSTFNVLVHTGFATAGAEANYQPTNGCCGYGSNLGVGADGSVFLAYYSNATDQGGYWMQQLAPTVGAPTLLPRIGTSGLSRGSRIPLVSRVGGGVYAAYCDVYPTCSGIRLAAQGRPSLRLALTNAQVPTVADSVWAAAGPSGRIWLTWTNRDGLYLTRTNKAVTKWEPVQKLALPRVIDTPWSTTAEGSRGWLDIVATLGVTNAAGATEIRAWHQRAKPKLSLVAPLAVQHSNRARTVLLRLTDAGDPVVGKVRFRGVTRTTNVRGYASFTIPRGTRTGSYVASATATGYVAGLAKVRVHFM
ncbi:MAG: hypothetical protein JWM86_2640 [Thermoleophilia bacterium]|nr:hypothetical protein [Thermoleophilia bacterium]